MKTIGLTFPKDKKAESKDNKLKDKKAESDKEK